MVNNSYLRFDDDDDNKIDDDDNKIKYTYFHNHAKRKA